MTIKPPDQTSQQLLTTRLCNPNEISLAQIRQALCSQALVEHAVVLGQPSSANTPSDLASFVTLSRRFEDDTGSALTTRNVYETECVEAWTDLYDSWMYSDIDTIDYSRLGKDFMCWVSMYDGEPINHHQMTEWLTDTITMILRQARPRNVLEIGTGTGMVLFGIIEQVQSYVGIEPSVAAATFANNMAQAQPALAKKVQVKLGTATDVVRLSRLNSPDVAILNSVIQYFPSADYLYDLLESLLRIDSMERIFLGDVRSYALYQEFLTTQALHKYGMEATKSTMRQHLARMEASETQLLVDPGFFTSLRTRMPSLVEHVEILPKRMKFANELSCYRYAVLIHAKPKSGMTFPMCSLGEDAWLDFEANNLCSSSLHSILQRSTDSAVIAVSNIRNKDIMFERHIVNSLNDEGKEMDGWLGKIHRESKHNPAMSISDLVELGATFGFQVDISWACQRSHGGAMDAIFHKPQDGRRIFLSPHDHENQDVQSLTNHPLLRRKAPDIETQLLHNLRFSLPTELIPTCIGVLDRMPFKTHEANRQALGYNLRTTLS